jgi:hypothetical protein
MSTETCQESSLLKKRQDVLRQAGLAKPGLDDQAEVYLFTKDKLSTFPLKPSSPPPFSPLVERIGKHAVEPLLLPGLEASHLGSCYELSSQRTKFQEPLCPADAVKFCTDGQVGVSSEEDIELRSPEATFSRDSISLPSFLSYDGRTDIHAVEPSLPPGTEATF